MGLNAAVRPQSRHSGSEIELFLRHCVTPDAARPAKPLRVRGAVLLPLGTVGGNALRSANQPALLVAQGALEAIAEHVESGSVFVCGDGIGHGWAFERV
jgi:hypothetical protein